MASSPVRNVYRDSFNPRGDLRDIDNEYHHVDSRVAAYNMLHSRTERKPHTPHLQETDDADHQRPRRVRRYVDPKQGGINRTYNVHENHVSPQVASNNDVTHHIYEPGRAWSRTLPTDREVDMLPLNSSRTISPMSNQLVLPSESTRRAAWIPSCNIMHHSHVSTGPEIRTTQMRNNHDEQYNISDLSNDSVSSDDTCPTIDVNEYILDLHQYDDDEESSRVSDGELLNSHSVSWHQPQDNPMSSDLQQRSGATSATNILTTNESRSKLEINLSKAMALKSAMMYSLLRLRFHEEVTRVALEEAVEHMTQQLTEDSERELAYVDIFITLIKFVADAHHNQLGNNESLHPQDYAQLHHDISSQSIPFRWPVFDMAQFEFGNARTGTCFENVCVLINLPKVSTDRAEMLMEVLSCHLFSMVGDPIQVVIPSMSATGRTKGHAFLEFDEPTVAKMCAAAVDGLTWGRGPYGRIRASLFRQYHVTAVPPTLFRSIAQEELNNRNSTRGQHFSGSSNSLETGCERNRETEPSRHPFNPDRVDDALNNFLADTAALSPRNMLSSTTPDDDDYDRPSSRRSTLQRLIAERATFTSSPSPQFDDYMAEGIDRLDLSSDEEDDNDGVEIRVTGDEESSVTESDLDLELDMRESGQLRQMDLEFQQSPLPSRMYSTFPEYVNSTFTSPPVSLTSFIERQGDDATTIAHDQDRFDNSSSGSWRIYCEELIARNREMHEQLSYSRRRITAMGHNNQKLHLLIDRMERDRDGLLFENDLLQTQLRGFEDHDRQQQALMSELTTLRESIKQHGDQRMRSTHSSYLNRPFTLITETSHKHGVDVDFDGTIMPLDEVEDQLTQNILRTRRLDDLKEWETMLETSLTRVRSIKEEIALELQRKVAQQGVDENMNDQKLCVICLSNEKCILCLPCRHLCLCQACSQHEQLEKCPICRLVVEKMLLVYA